MTERERRKRRKVKIFINKKKKVIDGTVKK